MPRKKTPEAAPQPELTSPREEAAEHLLQRVEIGRELEQRDIKSEAGLRLPGQIEGSGMTSIWRC